MTNPSWPAELPPPLRDGYGSVLPDARTATKPEAGPPRVRRRWSVAVATRQMTIDVTADQRARFWRFWLGDTVGGSLPFWVPDWTVDGAPMADASGSPLTTAAGAEIALAKRDLVMFGTSQPPSEAPVGVRWRITFQILVMP